ncbi:MAG TPA: cupin domain-containing protein [Mycobacterium sp.]|jgi:quercetin dioxygenase-like cupin family protein|nr:cupin domain-containing protein [Mycobacterium sp.]
MTTHATTPNHESAPKQKLITDLEISIDPRSPESMFIDLNRFQVFDGDDPTVTLVCGATDDEKIGIVVWNLEPGQENERHMHPAIDHVHVVLTGEAEYHLASGPALTVRAGQAVMVPAGVMHGIRNVRNERCSYLAVTSPGNYEKVLETR